MGAVESITQSSSGRIWAAVQESAMSELGRREPWVERHWSWLVILFGVLFVTLLDSFAPKG